MPLLTDYNNSTNTDFVYKVMMGLISTAIAVQAELASVPSHPLRSTFALKVLANPFGYAQLMAASCTVDGTMDLTATDTVIKNRLSAVWNAYAVQG